MSTGAVRSAVRDAVFSVHGVDAVVTVPDGEPVETRVIWMTPETAGVPSSEGFARADQRRVVAIRRDHIPAVPRGTVIAVAEPLLEEPSLWLVDAMETVRSDQFRVVVIPQEVE